MLVNAVGWVRRSLVGGGLPFPMAVVLFLASNAEFFLRGLGFVVAGRLDARSFVGVPAFEGALRSGSSGSDGETCASVGTFGFGELTITDDMSNDVSVELVGVQMAANRSGVYIC